MAEPRDLEQWTTDLVAALGLDARGLDRAVDIAGVLDLARLAAHRVARPAAPVTTFLAGFALARGATLEQVADIVTRLARGADADADAHADAGAEPR
ncbi:DUF6457 domain-containing protein [Agromyces ramosus]|uniref:DUF6457 domain-containing protein n=1 Tax=Agromyces ramosus TaxID=33879 RepID=A0ABU0R3H6_9MICO|nr:DUF6457 domain-containing protein [Agromyces ramosus]MDQ0892640.1 hypothetical protein [Agromyces ramosus]